MSIVGSVITPEGTTTHAAACAFRDAVTTVGALRETHSHMAEPGRSRA
jgi:hypothetical protein